MITSNNEWQRVAQWMTTGGKTSDNQWQRAIKNNNEWQPMTGSGTTNENEWEQIK